MPSGLAAFPNEVMLTTRAVASYKFKNILQFSYLPDGGHFAALEVPELMVQDVRSFVRKVVAANK